LDLSPRHGASLGCGWREGLQICRVAANLLNKQSGIAEKKWSSSLGLCVVLTTPHRKNELCYEVFQSSSALNDSLARRKKLKKDFREIGIDGVNWIRLAQDVVQWRAFVSTVMNLRVP
jgi:hypothetical protein